MSDKIRVLIVDDVATTRDNIVKLMQFHPDLEAVGRREVAKKPCFRQERFGRKLC